ncbi:High mobility group protein B1 [Tupaia chinensis]|uniref:High mobility group protein B1 n=1 Tax=Tupaia chinensis TaxID=246437 RepID=L9LGD4_TUPCH|nr:High mobility group protein B1 [Tupaia chinensis]
MSAKEKGKFEDMAKVDKARYEREMKTYIPPTRETKKFKDSNAPKRPPSAFFLFCSEYRPKIKGEHPGLSTAKGKPDAAKKGVAKAEKSKKKEEEEDEEDEEDEEEEEDEEDEDEEDDDE